jgi:ParB/RepB/Spo0J family partition protein
MTKKADLFLFEHIELFQLLPHPLNPRKKMDPVKLQELADNVGVSGVLEPLLVRPKLHSPERFEIIAGHRRAVAATMAGLSVVPCVIREITDKDALAMMLAENIHRADLHLLEESDGVLALQAAGCDIADVERRLNVSRDWVQLRLELRCLEGQAREKLRALPMPVTVAEGLVRVPAEDREHAVQMLLQFGTETTAREARDYLEMKYVVPARLQLEWDRRIAREKKANPQAVLLERWNAAGDYIRPWGDTPTGQNNYRRAELHIGHMAAKEVDEDITWGALSRTHGIPTLWVPVGGDPFDAELVEIAEIRRIIEVEASLRDNGKPHVIGKRVASEKTDGPTDSGTATDEEEYDGPSEEEMAADARIDDYEKQLWDELSNQLCGMVDALNDIDDSEQVVLGINDGEALHTLEIPVGLAIIMLRAGIDGCKEVEA